VIEHYKGDLSRINMDPDRREELMEKYRDFAAEVAARYEAGETEAASVNQNAA